MDQSDRAALIERAADLFARLQADPENCQLLAERDAFLAMGETHQNAYATVTKAWVGAGQKPRTNSPKLLFALALLAGLALLATDPLRVSLMLGFTSGT